MSDKNNQDKAKVDEELTELLDSALQDFTTSDETKKEVEEKQKPEEVNAGDGEWSEEFIKSAVKNFDSNFMNILGGQSDGAGMSEEQLKQNFEQMAAAAQVFLNQDGGEPSAFFTETITQAIKEMSEVTDPTPLAGGDSASLMPPFMQDIMHSLLSKEVLYPSLKDVLDRFPEWLENNKSKISAEDLTRYEKQQKLMRKVCNVLEEEKETDSKEIKGKRFEQVLNLMQKLQDYGHPPTDLVGEIEPAPDMKNCSVM